MKILLSNPTEYKVPKIPKTHIKNSVGIIIDTICDGEAGSLSVVLIGYTTENTSMVTLEVTFTLKTPKIIRTTACVKIKNIVEQGVYFNKFYKGCEYLLSQIFDIYFVKDEHPLNALKLIADECSTSKNYVLLGGDTLMLRTCSARGKSIVFEEK